MSYLDWEYIKQRLSAQKISPTLLYSGLKKSGLIEKLPKNLQSDLRSTYLFNLAKNAIFLDEFIKIQSVFETEKIPLMPLKGIAFLFCVYKDIGLRPMADIDFLILKKDVEKAKNLLLKLNYREEYCTFNYSKTERGRPVLLDMHHDIWYLKTLSRHKSDIYGLKQIWRDSRRFYLEDGNSALIMSPQDLLINVAAHACLDHSQPTGVWLYDIVSICNVYKNNMHWQLLIDKVISYNLQIPFHQTLKSAKENFGAGIPQFVLEELRLKNNRYFEFRFYKAMQESLPIPKIGHLLRILTSARLSGKLRLILFYFFPDKEFMLSRYKIRDKRLVCFYYPLRIISLFSMTVGIMCLFFSREYKRSGYKSSI